MAIGNFRTATGVSQPVRRGGNGGGRLTYGSAIPHLTGAGEGFRSMERMGASVRQLGMHLERNRAVDGGVLARNEISACHEISLA